MSVRIIVSKGDITSYGCDAVVNPANSCGTMGGGVALALKTAGGDIIEREAVKQAPIQLGRAIATTAGALQFGFVIHAPTMEKPAEPAKEESVDKAVYFALDMANRLGAKSVAFPGMGTGIGGLDKARAAEIMIRAIARFLKERDKRPDLRLEKVILIAYDDELFKEFLKWNKELNPAIKSR